MTVLLIQSQYPSDGMAPSPFEGAAAEGRVRPVRDLSLREKDFVAVSGLITTTHLDQIGFLRFADAVAAFLAGGGRWIFSGHMVRPPIGGLGVYRRLESPKRGDFALVRLCRHPIFDGIDQKTLETNHGVAGFYGRGYNPLPEGAVAINGIGPNHHPIDWVWRRPEGGAILSHAGNEFWGCGDDGAIKQQLADRAVAWANGELAAGASWPFIPAPITISKAWRRHAMLPISTSFAGRRNWQRRIFRTLRRSSCPASRRPTAWRRMPGAFWTFWIGVER